MRAMQQKAHETSRAEKKTRLCPICGKPASEADRPFCSCRCADIDLHRWLNGAYALPVRPDDDEDDSALDEAQPEQG
jgi:uncharacterized protein